MDLSLKRKLLAYLASAALVVGSGSVSPARAQLIEIPEQIVDDLLEDIADDDWPEQDLVRLVDLLAEDPREQVRRRASELLADLSRGSSHGLAEPVLRKLALDPSRVVRSATGVSLARWLSVVDGLHRARLVLEWALDPATGIRRTLARALADPFPVFASDLVIEHLGRDPDAAVRASVARAASSRFSENPETYRAILEKLSTDENRKVRRLARRAAHRLERLPC